MRCKNYVEQKVNKEYERYIFRQSNQKLKGWTHMKTNWDSSPQKCEYADNDREVKSKIIQIAYQQI